MAGTKDKKVYTYLDDELYEQVSEDADMLHRSIAGQVRYIVDRYYGRLDGEEDRFFASDGVVVTTEA